MRTASKTFFHKILFEYDIIFCITFTIRLENGSLYYVGRIYVLQRFFGGSCRSFGTKRESRKAFFPYSRGITSSQKRPENGQPKLILSVSVHDGGAVSDSSAFSFCQKSRIIGNIPSGTFLLGDNAYLNNEFVLPPYTTIQQSFINQMLRNETI